MFTEFISGNLFAFFLVFARIGAALMLLPPFGEVFVFVRAHLSLALIISAVLTPLLLPLLPPIPESPLFVMLILVGEVLAALAGSYQTLAPGTLPFVGDFSLVAVRYCSEAFVVALQITAPVVVLGLLFYLGLGVLARLIPAVQVFFIALPLQIVLGFWVVMVALSGMMLWYLDYFGEGIRSLFSEG